MRERRNQFGSQISACFQSILIDLIAARYILYHSKIHTDMQVYHSSYLHCTRVKLPLKYMKKASARENFVHSILFLYQNMSTSSVSLLTRELSFAPYDVKWIPCSSRVCTVGATNHGTGKIAVYNLVGKQLELKTEVILISQCRICQ